MRLALLADAGEVLARSFDRIEEMADALGRALVPNFVDWFAFHHVDGNGAVRELASHASDQLASTELGSWDDVVRDAREADPELVWGDALLEDRYLAARSRELTSVLLVRVQARDLVFGVITFGTAGRRRGLRPGDCATAVDLAARVAVAMERVLLEAQTQQSAVRAARHATSASPRPRSR
jgi:GAF domain-containing protein